MPSCVAISISELNVAKLSPENYTSEIAETVVRQLDNLTSSQNLTSTNVTSTVDVLESLVTLQEKVLEEGGSLNLSNEFVNSYVETSANLLAKKTGNSWLNLDSDNGAPAFMESMEKFARVIAFSTAAEGNETRCFSSANVGMRQS
jgi:hypothetical protein